MPGLTDDMPGELLHKLGEEGARRAKVWLDSTTRVSESWSVYDKFGVSKLKYPWPHAEHGYSYDLGGILRGGELHKQSFLVECKKYTTDNQGTHFDKFLAQSYVTLRDQPYMADQFMWITWHPFRLGAWNQLSSPESIEKAIVKFGLQVFGTEDEPEVRAQIKRDVVEDLSERIWVIVLSDQQETLVISKDDRAELMKLRIQRDED